MRAVYTFAEGGVGMCGTAGAVGRTAGAAAGAVHRSALVTGAAHVRERSRARVLIEPMLLQHARQCRVRVQSSSSSSTFSTPSARARSAEAGRLGQSAGREREGKRESWRA